MSNESKTPKDSPALIKEMSGGRAPIGMMELRESRAPIAMTPVASNTETATQPKSGDTSERGRGCVPMIPVHDPQQGRQQQPRTPGPNPPLKK